MRCAACDHDNRDAAKFCEDCGQALAAPSTKPPPSGARDVRGYTPKHLAERILTARTALEGERKQVTVLFVDVQNSMQLAEHVGAEDWHKALDRFFHIVNEGVHRVEGTVNQYTGDGVMALFGAPLAHEDHAQRACHAAVELRDRLRALGDELGKKWALPFAVRLGLNSGEVVVGAIGDDLRMDYTAQGHTVGLAQRVEQLAASNTICVAQPTAALVADYFHLRDLGDFELKGVSEPVRVHELERARSERSRIDVVLARSSTPLVGRRAELADLERALDEALVGQGQVIGVVGEPGVGKTRLCLELAQHCVERGAVLAQAHCPAHAASVPWLPIVELLRSLFDIHAEDAPGASRRKIRRAAIKLNRSFSDALPFLFDALEVPDPERPVKMAEEQRSAELSSLLRRIVQAQSAAAPLVLFVDDIQCADAGSDALLGEIVDALGWTRTLLLVNFRPGHRSSWMTARHYRELVLSPLPEDDVDELLLGLMGDHASTTELRQLIRDRTGGNPFFTEEVVQSLVEHGALERRPGDLESMQLSRPVADLSIPATVQALLAARLDRLPPRDKLVLQAAAVIGRTFSPAVLRRLLAHEVASEAAEPLGDDAVAGALAAMEEAEFLRREGDETDAEYAFRHPLTQAVAYGSQLAEARARMHVGVARALQHVHAAQLGQQAALLAHHFEAANWKFEAMRWRRRAALRVTSIELGRPRRS